MNSNIQTPPVRVRWRNSLIFRTILLCVVLVLCLMGAVYLLTTHYYSRLKSEMIAHTEAIAGDIQVQLSTHPNEDLSKIAPYLENDYTNVELRDLQDVDVPTQVSVTIDENGNVTKTARTTLHFAGRRILLTATVSLSPETEIVRAFKDQNLLAITAVFIVALTLMIYFIRKTLRPLGELSETCSRISSGDLKTVAMRKSSGEVLALERTFNQMVESLREKEVMEVKLRQAQRLSAIGNLAAGVAHDVRNPLNAIKLLSSHTIDILGNAPESERAAKQIRTIREEVDRIEDIVSSFLSLAREREIVPEPCHVDSLLQECVHLIEQDAKSRQIRLSAELRTGVTELMLDQKQWRRAIVNVLLNALDACPPEGRVRIFSRLNDSVCEIEVRDDGPGMSRESIEHAFDPYFTTKPTGTGLGLSITRGIIEEHGGSIELYSFHGQGTQVLITMPLRKESKP